MRKRRITMKTGFIGLGHLGKAMARRLISTNAELSVWNRTREKTSGLGVPAAESPAKLISSVDVVFLNLFDSDAVAEVITGRDGLLEGDCKGKVIVDTTTNHFGRVGEFYSILSEKEASYLEAPVLGSVVPASKGALTVLVSGGEAAYEKALPLLERIGRPIFYLIKPTLATKMKLINNLVLGAFMTSIAEAFVFAEECGLDKPVVFDILSAGAGNSAVLNAKKEMLLNEDFTRQFSSSLIYKDLHYMQDLARTLKKPLFTGSVVKELYGMAFPRHIEDLDFSAVYRIMKEY
jgi:3-hydroxyisobutyrate dehydrogenase